MKEQEHCKGNKEDNQKDHKWFWFAQNISSLVARTF